MDGDRLTLRQVLPSGGDFPVSVTVHGDHAYVLNALGGGSLYGYRIDGDRLTPIPGSYRALGLGTTAGSQFTATPGQVAFTSDGSQLLVTTKATGNDVDVFAVRPDGRLSSVARRQRAARYRAVRGRVRPWRATWCSPRRGPTPSRLIACRRGGTLTQLAVAATGQMATCWVVRAGAFFYASNAGSGSVSGYQAAWSGALTALGNTATDAGTVDAASAASGRFLYVQTGKAGIVDEFAVAADGSLTPIGSVTVPGGAGGEGIAAA